MQTNRPNDAADEEEVIPLEGLTNSFIVKIWLEEAINHPARLVWRGHITQVPSHQRMYFQSLNAIPVFIAPFLARLGVEIGMYWRLRLMLQDLPRLFASRSEKDEE